MPSPSLGPASTNAAESFDLNAGAVLLPGPPQAGAVGRAPAAVDRRLVVDHPFREPGGSRTALWVEVPTIAVVLGGVLAGQTVLRRRRASSFVYRYPTGGA